MFASFLINQGIAAQKVRALHFLSVVSLPAFANVFSVTFVGCKLKR